MNIRLFEITNIGNTTLGEKLADKLGYDFYDSDEELIIRFARAACKEMSINVGQGIQVI